MCPEFLTGGGAVHIFIGLRRWWEFIHVSVEHIYHHHLLVKK